MKTYEGSLNIKWEKDGAVDKRPLTVDIDENTQLPNYQLQREKNRIIDTFMDFGENGKYPYSVSIKLHLRK